MTCVVTDPELKDAPRLFLSHTIVCVCSLELHSSLTETQALNGFVSSFDPLTKYCLATQALIEPCLHNSGCHNLHRHHSRLSSTIIARGEASQGSKSLK